ncbi:hypothetical protein RvY_13754 [Ramazzottius varieornatus]|uniref:Uncharacterized protein n=1 Tax=Ramazzottius varieornatus TaxID=947166 RepID=A0A1D1VQT1_RAMVA|nr:hypothetical protein RvY_13754 [Ramazzottius varieornatus]
MVPLHRLLIKRKIPQSNSSPRIKHSEEPFRLGEDLEARTFALQIRFTEGTRLIRLEDKWDGIHKEAK